MSLLQSIHSSAQPANGQQNVPQATDLEAMGIRVVTMTPFHSQIIVGVPNCQTMLFTAQVRDPFLY